MNRIASIAAIAATSGLATGQVINEFQPNPTGTDPSQVAVEIRGVAGASFSGVLYSVDTDFENGPIDRESAVSGTFDANGLLVVMIDDLENPSFDFILASNAGLLGQDSNAVDYGTVFDAIGIIDAAGDAGFSMAASLGGTLIAFTGDEPGLVFRDGLDSSIIYAINDPAGSVAFDQFGNEYDLATDFLTIDGVATDISGFVSTGLLTEGLPNLTTIPAPTGLAVLGLSGLVAGRRRRG
ncbi:MAG: hypothetical protein AAGJ54_11670 [Planctomycetota bacterium]